MNDFTVIKDDIQKRAIGFDATIQNVIGWLGDRNLIEGSTPKDQYCKLIEEAGELSSSICKKRNPRDDIGDMLVVLICIATQHELTIQECLDHAYNEIKDRKGRMVDGIFVKEE